MVIYVYIHIQLLELYVHTDNFAIHTYFEDKVNIKGLKDKTFCQGYTDEGAKKQTIHQ